MVECGLREGGVEWTDIRKSACDQQENRLLTCGKQHRQPVFNSEVHGLSLPHTNTHMSMSLM